MRYLLLLVFHLLAFLLRAQEIGSWEDHLPYQNGVSITHSENEIIVSAKAGIFYYSLEDFSLRKLSKADGLSDVSQWSVDNSQLISYHPQLKLLLIAYTNGNIDVVRDNEVINIPDIKNAPIIGAKRINAIDFIGNYAYLSTSFGVVVIDLEKYQVKDTYQIGESGEGVTINDFTIFQDTFYAATANGVYKAVADGSVNLLNFNNWRRINQPPLLEKNTLNAFAFDNQLFVVQRDSMFSKTGNGWELFFAEEDWEIINYSLGVGKLILTVSRFGSDNFVPLESEIVSLDANGSKTVLIGNDLLGVPYQAIEYRENEFWVADFYNGLVKHLPGGNAYISPNGPGSERVFKMCNGSEKLYVVAGGITEAFDYKFVRDGFFTYEEGFWNSNNQYNYPILEDFLDMIDVVVSDQTGVAFFASYYGGVVAFDNGQITTWTKNNSALQAPSGDSSRTTATGLALDNNGNLWVTNHNVARPLVVITPNGDSYNYGFPGNVNQASSVAIDEYGQKWVVCERNGDAGLVVYDDAGTLDNTSDDRSKIINQANGSGSLQTNRAVCVAVDKDGAVWVGTEEGVAVFHCPGSVLTTGCEASRPLVEQDGNFSYLLENEVIHDIEVDGANRKWFATNSGAFLMNEDGEEQIAYFSASNSPLLSDAVRDITIDPKTGTVFFGTDNGIVSYVGTSANAPNPGGECKVYPNPVRPGYEGLVTIDGVVPNASVKITDASGNLFYETTALGSRVTWDATNYNGERAKSGVYLIFISNENGTQTKICKLVIVN